LGIALLYSLIGCLLLLLLLLRRIKLVARVLHGFGLRRRWWQRGRGSGAKHATCTGLAWIAGKSSGRIGKIRWPRTSSDAAS
jgi:uncharacterized membrane protein YecN with MAPEG domain